MDHNVRIDISKTHDINDNIETTMKYCHSGSLVKKNWNEDVRSNSFSLRQAARCSTRAKKLQ